ncbi:MAG: hypothetical protein ACRDE2_06465 [Chitinophagaceae bacterium]
MPSVNHKMLQYFMQLSEAEKKSVLQLVKAILENKETPPMRISMEQYNKEIEEAEAEFQKGDYITHDEMLNRMKRW